MDFEAIVNNVMELVIQPNGHNTTRKHQKEIERIQKKKEALLDSFCSGEIAKADMMALKQKYEDQLAQLQKQESQETHALDPNALSATIRTILNGEMESEAFYKTMLDSLTVYKDRHMELRLKHLPQVFHFAES